ncbi:MAG TPA: hypothetical protein VLT58_10660, partial [Polyangia bacterium]|nr:hypothetical protein [Polyangia bacterium]
ADKAVRTVATGRGTEDRPVPAEQRTRPVLDDAEVEPEAGGYRQGGNQPGGHSHGGHTHEH